MIKEKQNGTGMWAWFVGEAAITTGGNLKAKYVIHAASGGKLCKKFLTKSG